MLEPLNQITSHSDRFGSNSELLNQYFCEHSPRIGELTFLVNIVNLTKSARVLNIPPESKLLNVLAPTWKIDQADFEVSKRMEEEGIKKTCSNLSDFENNTYDAVIGIAPLHHLTDREQIKVITAAKQKLIPGGRLVIAEPLRGSSVAGFLDTLIDCYSLTGHKGNYPTNGLVESITQVGFKSVSAQTIDCGLVFSSEEEMIEWFKRFFGIKFSNKEAFLEKIKTLLSFKKTEKNLRLGWELTFFIAEL